MQRGRGAIAAPIQAPDLGNCHPPDLPNTAPDTNCCPTSSTGITDFELPDSSAPLRVRPAAQLVDAEYLAKYERAVALMMQLPADDPRSFEQQWRRRRRSRQEKEKEEEVLVVEGIEIADHFNKFVKFDVLVNEPEDGVDGTPETATAYCAGSVAHMPHMVRPEETRKRNGQDVARFGVCDLMDDIGAGGDRTVVVSLVPRSGGELVTVGGVSISYLK